MATGLSHPGSPVPPIADICDVKSSHDKIYISILHVIMVSQAHRLKSSSGLK